MAQPATRLMEGPCSNPWAQGGEPSVGMLALGEICDRTTEGTTVTRGLRTDGFATLLVLGGAGLVLFGSIAVSGIRTLSEAGLDDSSDITPVAVSLGAGTIPLAAPTFYAAFPAWAQTVLGSGISAGARVAALLNLFFHHLGTRSRTAVPALKSSQGPAVPSPKLSASLEQGDPHCHHRREEEAPWHPRQPSASSSRTVRSRP